MSEWKECTIGELCKNICSGGTPNRSNADFFRNGNIPWLNTKEVSFNRIYQTENFITEAGLKSSAAKWIPENTVVVAMYGATAGRSAIAKIPLTTNQACCNLVVDEDKADYRFVYYWLLGNYEHLASLANGGAQQNLNAGLIRDYKVRAPDLELQRKIADILSSLDDKIELNNQINRNLEEQIQTLFLEMFSNDPSEPLGTVVETTSGGTPNRKIEEFYENGSVCWVKSKELQGSFITDTEEKITNEALVKSAAKIIPANSVMIAMYGATVGEYGIISKEMACNQAVCALLENEKYPYTYLFMLVKTRKQDLINMAVGSAQQNISQVIIKEMLVHSDLDKIQKFHKCVAPLFQEMKQNKEENVLLKGILDYLLPKLMSNEINVDLARSNR